MDYQHSNGHGQSSYSLGHLAQQAQKLNSQLASSANATDLPSIQLGLDQIENQSRRLVARGNPTAQGLDPRAHYFLANAGIDAAELAENINSTNIASAFEPLQPVYDTDVESFLRHEHEQVILSAIEEGRRETLQDFHRNLERNMHRDWGFQKRKIFDELGQHQPGTNMDWSGGNASILEGSRGFNPNTSADLSRSLAPSGGQSMHMHGRMMRYNAIIEKLNENRLSSTPFPLVSNLLSAARSMTSISSNPNSDSRHQPLIESYEALVSIVGEKDVSLTTGEFQRSVVREREFSNSYVDKSSWNGKNGIELRKKLINGSLKYLESQFSKFVDDTIQSEPIKAKLGGKPSISNRIKAFLRIQLQTREGLWLPELEIVKPSNNEEKFPIWATLYYLIRSGNLKEALELSFENENLFGRLDQSFPSYFKAWFDSSGSNENEEKHLPKNLKDRFFTDFNARFRSGKDGQDPFKFALYKLIGRIDLNKKFPNVLIRTTENWMWLQLMMIREESDSIVDDSNNVNNVNLRDHFNLEMLSKKIRDYGESHFDSKGVRPLHYFQVLLLSAQFERAIAFLYSRPQFQVDVVQFASALAYYGLLRVPSSSQASQVEYLTSELDPTSLREISYLDFPKLIQRYTRVFSQNDAREALQYLYLICLSSDSPSPIGKEQVSKCHELIKNLVMETRQFEELLGSFNNQNGTKKLGLIEKYSKLINLINEKDYLSNIVLDAAKSSEKENRIKDSILLYNLAQEFDIVIQVLNKELGSNLMEPTARNSFFDNNNSNSNLELSNYNFSLAPDLISLSKLILESYSKQNHVIRSINPKNLNTLKILLTLKESISYFNSNEFEKSLSLVESLDLIPLKGDVISITKKAEEFKNVDENLSQNLQSLLLMIMKILFNLNESFKNSNWNDLIRIEKLKEIRNQSRCLMMWAGMLRFRLSSETYAQLTRLDVFIH